MAEPPAVSTVQDMRAAGFTVVRQIETKGSFRSSVGRPLGSPSFQTCWPIR